MSSATEPRAPADDLPEHYGRVVWRLAWPAVALNSLQVVNSLLDSYFVGSLEPAALTAVGAATSFVFLLFSMTFALGTAATAIVSRAYGAGNPDEYTLANRKCLGMAMWAGILFGLLGIPIAHLAATVMVPAGDLRASELVVQYFLIFCTSIPAMFIIQTLAGSLRGVGDTKSPMWISGIQILLHIVLNFFLIFPTRPVHLFASEVAMPGANMGLAGAALALSVSAWLAAGTYLLWAARTPLGSTWKLGLPGLEWARRILKIAAPAAMMMVVRVTSLMMFTKVLTWVPDGSRAIAALRVGFSIEALAFMPAFGLSVAAAALVGQSLGMGRPDRAERLAWAAAHYAGVVSLVVSAVLFIFADPAARLILPGQEEIAREVASFIRFICATEVFFGYGVVLTGAMQGAGDTTRPMWLTVISLWGIRVPLAAFLAVSTALSLGGAAIPIGLGMGAAGCWLAMSVTQATQGLLSGYVFRQGAWKTRKV